jgi:hypothetical protein
VLPLLENGKWRLSHVICFLGLYFFCNGWRWLRNRRNFANFRNLSNFPVDCDLGILDLGSGAVVLR